MIFPLDLGIYLAKRMCSRMQLRYADKIEIFSEKDQHISSTLSAKWNDVNVVQHIASQTLNIELCANETPVCFIRLRWNFSEAEKRSEIRVYGDEWERGYGAMAWQSIRPDRCMPWVCAVSNGSDRSVETAGRFTECFGVMTQPSAFCLWQYDTAGLTLWLDVRNGGEGVLLHGRTLQVCSVMMMDYRDQSAFDALKDFYHHLCPNPLIADHKVYGSNNWYYAYGKSSHEEILADAEFISNLCADQSNPPYMVIDDGWQLNPCDGPWNTGNKRFPDMKRLCEAMKEKGVRTGIWIRYLHDKAKQTENVTPEMLLMRDPEYLDPSHPDVLKKIREDTKRLTAEWGYQLIKHDFSTYDIFGFWGFQRSGFMAANGWHFYDRTRTTAEIILNLYKTIREAAGNQTILLGCNVIGHLAAGLVHMNRTGDDTSGFEWERTRKMGVNTLAFRMLHDEAFFDADADCVGITGKIPWDLNREWLKALSVSGTPLFVSCKPDIPNAAEMEDLKQAFARSAEQKDTLLPLDWMENACPEHWMLNGQEIHFNWYAEEGAGFRSVL